MTANSSSSFTYHNEIKGSKENGQDAIILIAFVAIGKPATAKMIQKYLKDQDRDLEINVVSRSVNNLHSGEKKPAKIIEVFKGQCEVTKRNHVSHYEPINFKVDVNGQIKLL
jgi:hypothetical protein